MGILLLVLKGIAVFLGVLLSIFLILLLLVLFVPVCYRAYGSYENQKLQVHLRISWFFILLRFTADWESQLLYKLRVLGIPVYPKSPKKETPQKKSVDSGSHTDIETSEMKTAFEEAPDRISPTVSISKTEPADSTETETTPAGDTTAPADTPNTSDNTGGTPKSSKKQRIKEFFTNIWYTIKKIYAMICSTGNRIHGTLEFLQSETVKNVVSLCKKELLYVWRHCRPGKFQIYVHAGFEDPAVMGELMSLYGMLYPFLSRHVTINSDFEQVILEAKFFLKGRITVFSLLKALLVIYFNKDFKTILLKFNKEE